MSDFKFFCLVALLLVGSLIVLPISLLLFVVPVPVSVFLGLACATMVILLVNKE